MLAKSHCNPLSPCPMFDTLGLDTTIGSLINDKVFVLKWLLTWWFRLIWILNEQIDKMTWQLDPPLKQFEVNDIVCMLSYRDAHCSMYLRKEMQVLEHSYKKVQLYF